jgi:hypothetical protein
MRSFQLATLVAGVVVSAFANPLAGQRVLADSVGPVTSEEENVSAGSCTSEDLVISVPSARESPCQSDAKEPGETARARAYLVATASPGYTMIRQGSERAIARLHPAFVNRLAAAIAEAREAGLSPEFSRPTVRLHSVSAALSTSSTRFIPTGLPSTSPGSAHPALQALCCGTRSRAGMA